MSSVPRPDRDSEYDEIMAKADSLEYTDNIEAISLYEEAFDINPKDPEPLIKKIDLFDLNDEEFEEMAISEADRLVGLFEDDPRSHIARGKLLVHVYKYEDAIKDFDAALRLDPDSAEACKLRGFAFIALGRHEDALAAYRLAVRLHPGDIEALTYLCSELEEAAKYDEALDVLVGYLSRDHAHYHIVYRHMGRVYGLLGNAKLSLESYVKSVSTAGLDLSDPDEKREYEEIVRICERLKNMDPLDPGSFYGGALALFWANRLLISMDMLKTATQMRPEAWAYGMLAKNYASFDRTGESIDCYKRALDLLSGATARGPPRDNEILRYQDRWYGDLIHDLYECGRYREVLKFGKEASDLDVAHYAVREYYGRVLEKMGPEPEDLDQISGGWTAKWL